MEGLSGAGSPTGLFRAGLSGGGLWFALSAGGFASRGLSGFAGARKPCLGALKLLLAAARISSGVRKPSRLRSMLSNRSANRGGVSPRLSLPSRSASKRAITAMAPPPAQGGGPMGLGGPKPRGPNPPKRAQTPQGVHPRGPRASASRAGKTVWRSPGRTPRYHQAALGCGGGADWSHGGPTGPKARGPAPRSPRPGGPNQDGPNAGGPNAGAPKPAGPNLDAPNAGGPDQGGPNAGGPNRPRPAHARNSRPVPAANSS